MGLAEVTLVLEHVGCVKPGEKLLLVALADRANEQGHAWPSHREMARRSNQSRATVKRQLRHLREIGIISWTPRRKSSPGYGSRQSSSDYALDIKGMRAGRYAEATALESQQKSWSHPGAQNEPLGHSATERPGAQNEPLGQNAWSQPGAQNEPLGGPGAQNEGGQGLTSELPMNYQPELPTLPSDLPRPGEGPAQPAREGAPAGAGEGEFSPERFSEAHADSASPESGGAEDMKIRAEISESLSQARQNADSVTEVDSAALDTEKPSKTPQQPRNASGRAEDQALIRTVLPPAMQMVPANAHQRIAAAIRERLDAGWTAESIRAVLASWELPDNVRSLTGLVLARLRDGVPVNGAPTPPTAARTGLVTSDGRQVRRSDLDTGSLAIAYRSAVREGTCSPEVDRWKWAESVGVEKFLY